MKKFAMVAVLFAFALASVGCGGTPSTKPPVVPATTAPAAK
jgi:hypothetical protein